MKLKEEHIKDLIPDYLDGKLNAKEKAWFEHHIKDSPEYEKELAEYKALFATFKEEPEQIPSENLREDFLKMLEEEKGNQVRVVSLKPTENSKNRGFGLLKIAASIALLIAVFLLGQQSGKNSIKEEVAVMQKQHLDIKQTAMISLLENQSASRRIQGVSYIQDFQHPDESILAALADRMLNDENMNVRLTALEALSNFTSSEMVKAAFVEALKSEKNPSLQIAIIQVLVQIQEKRAIEPMKKLLEQQDTQPFIKEEIHTVIPKII